MATKAEMRAQIQRVIDEAAQLEYENRATARIRRAEGSLPYLRHHQLIDVRKGVRRWLQEAKDEHARFERLISNATPVAQGTFASETGELRLVLLGGVA